MKKLVIALFCITTIAGFTSCKKDYKCVCKDSGSDPVVIEINNTRRPEASTACNTYDWLYDDGCSLD